MFCPRCSQEQISEEIKFCSHCGFPLTLVSEVLAHNGFLPQLAETNKDKKRWTRKNGLVFSLFWFMFFVLIMVPIVAIDNADDAFVMAVLGTMGGLLFAVATLIYSKNEPKSAKNLNQELPNYNIQNLREFSQTNALPPQQNQPAQSYVSPASVWKAPNTNDLIEPRSVTEGTTKLFKTEQ